MTYLLTYLANKLVYCWERAKPVLLWPVHALWTCIKVGFIVALGIAFVLYVLLSEERRR